MLSKLADQSLLTKLDQSKYLSVVESIFNCGTTYLREKIMHKAILWLTQCHSLVFHRDASCLLDLRIKTVQNLIRAYLWRNEHDDLEQAASLLESAAEDYPVAAWLYFLRLDYALLLHPGNSEPLTILLESLIRIVHLTDDVFHSIIRKVHELFKIDRRSTCRVLDLLLPKSADLGEIDWVEKALVTRIWVATQISESDHDDCINRLSESFNRLEKKLMKSLGSRAVHAAQIVRLPLQRNE